MKLYVLLTSVSVIKSFRRFDLDEEMLRVGVKFLLRHCVGCFQFGQLSFEIIVSHLENNLVGSQTLFKTPYKPKKTS